jgi:DNA-nicking Smr family endonuclease
MTESVVTVNLEMGHPTVEEARRLLKAELEKCRSRKVTAVKVIHGYGSSGVGGALRQGIRLRRKLEHLRSRSTLDAGTMSRIDQR